MPSAFVLVRTQHTRDYTKPDVEITYNLHNKLKTPYSLDPSLQWSESAPLRDPVLHRRSNITLAAGTQKVLGVDIELLRASYIRRLLYDELLGRVCGEMREAMTEGALGLQWYGDSVDFYTGAHMRCAANTTRSYERHVWWDIFEVFVDLE
ncbi:hypothetical protein ACJQWK_00029 [Exserohilum turcicum]|uniref:Uncharacterized protein n=1 Tax=Exserohilum turcicum (strain 28A) TaxID=671987 RepID=R0JR78_EXST2|nr:uncharacterized protein SETTUDRAFT_22314 [Exserohilum turcica Et28A]EOA83618.1 hypothetical protein SETTUDRAFT_22314 [Exserohilum turcica Et28A]